MNLDKSILTEFEQVTQKNITQFLVRVASFLQKDRPTILAYYNDASRPIDPTAFGRFELLQKELKSVFEVYQLHSSVFNNSRWWDVIELLEQIDSVFSSLKNTHRWSRSSISRFGYSPNIQIDYTLPESQTLERVSQDVLVDENPNDQWYDIAIANDLTEEEYEVRGGSVVQLQKSRNRGALQLQSVMDIMFGKSIYGIDLNRRINFVKNNQDQSDLALLGYDDTLLQSVEILTNLKKNSNPEFPSDGLQTEVTVGANRALLNFPIIIRQMTQTFASDDTLKNFVVKAMSYQEDNLLITYEVEDRLDETYSGQTTF
jgi:hypothetical protein